MGESEGSIVIEATALVKTYRMGEVEVWALHGVDFALRAREMVVLLGPSGSGKTSALGVDEQRVNVVLDPEGPSDAWVPLGDGFAAEIETTVWSKPEVVQVPASALFRQGGGWSVFVVRGGRAAARPVQVGHRGALEAEILGGLDSDEVVIIHPGASVHEGAKVASRQP